MAAVEDLVPHRGSALLLERVAEEREDGVVCVGRVPRDAALARGGRAPSFLGMEMVAQAAAAFEGLRRRRESAGAAPSVGYLVSLGDVAVGRPDMAVETSLVVTVRLLGASPPLARYEGSVRSEDGEVYVRGVLRTALAPAARQEGAR
jgi:predicted hotdog family 3-hydroxylacyl-ACP dehydratase